MMQRIVLLLFRLVPSAGLLSSWTAARPRASQRAVQVQRSCSSASSQSPGATGSNDEPHDALVPGLLELFQGEFDNYDQVVADRKAGMMPGPGGGHEHIHCSLKVLDPALVPEQVAAASPLGGKSSSKGGEGGDMPQEPDRPLAVVAAKYYFNGDSNVVFRYRLYSFHACPPNTPGARGDAVMRLWRLLPHVEARLRAKSYDLTAFDWSDNDNRHHPRQQEPRSKIESNSNQGSEASTSEIRDDVVERIVGCEIYWGWHREGAGGGGASLAQGAGADDATAEPTATAATTTTTTSAGGAGEGGGPFGRSFVGVMGEDDSGTWVESQNVDGLEILVKDDLRLWPDQLWVNDRGFDREGNFVYGNQRNVPYKMRRVVADGPLAWTLGARHRTKGAYAEKMSSIGVTPGQRLGPPVRRAGAPAGAGG